MFLEWLQKGSISHSADEVCRVRTYQFGADHGDLPYTLNHKMLSSRHDVKTLANGREHDGLKGSLTVCYRIYGLVSTRARRSYCRFPGSFEACMAS